MVRPVGLEPTTPGLKVRSSDRLSYGRTATLAKWKAPLRRGFLLLGTGERRWVQGEGGNRSGNPGPNLHKGRQPIASSAGAALSSGGSERPPRRSRRRVTSTAPIRRTRAPASRPQAGLPRLPFARRSRSRTSRLGIATAFDLCPHHVGVDVEVGDVDRVVEKRDPAVAEGADAGGQVVLLVAARGVPIELVPVAEALRGCREVEDAPERIGLELRVGLRQRTEGAATSPR